jgi:hypothetical protein
MKNISFSTLAERWPSAWVSRTKIQEFSGGLINEKYLANLDSQGRGPAGRIRVGRKIAYPVVEVIHWLESRAEAVADRHHHQE